MTVDAVPAAAAHDGSGQAGHDAALHLEAVCAEARHKPRNVSPPATSSVPGRGRAAARRAELRVDTLRRLVAGEARRQVEAGERAAPVAQLR